MEGTVIVEGHVVLELSPHVELCDAEQAHGLLKVLNQVPSSLLLLLLFRDGQQSVGRGQNAVPEVVQVVGGVQEDGHEVLEEHGSPLLLVAFLQELLAVGFVDPDQRKEVT